MAFVKGGTPWMVRLSSGCLLSQLGFEPLMHVISEQA